MTIEVNKEELIQEMASFAQRFEALLRAIPSNAINKPVAGLTWNVGEVAAHVVTVMRRSLGDRRRSSNPFDLSELNALLLTEFDERDPQQLANRFATDMAIILKRVLPRIPDDLEFPFHAGIQTTIVPAIAVMVGEMMIHGRDIANAIDYEWKVSPYSAALVFYGSSPVLHGWLKPEARELHETYVIHFTSEPDPIAVWIKDGTVTINQDIPDSPDYEVHVDPIEFALTFPYKRQPHENEALNRLAGYFEDL